jgi:hypothetical protein
MPEFAGCRTDLGADAAPVLADHLHADRPTGSSRQEVGSAGEPLRPDLQQQGLRAWYSSEL